MIKITSAYLRAQGFSPTFEIRFWSKVRKSQGCWIWQAAIAKGHGDYGKLGKNRLKDGWIPAHRASWILNRGPIPKNLRVLHRCPGGANPKCVNPDHLYLGTDKDNAMDTIRDGRHGGGPPVGDKNHNAKLTWEKAAKIRRLYRTGLWSLKLLAWKFKVWENVIWMIVHNKSWKITPSTQF